VSALPAREVEAPGWYLYGIVAADEAHEPLAGVIGRVSLDEFDEAALSERLADAAWLERNIRAHEKVLESVLSTASVVPCRFCTVYRNEEELRRFISDRSDELAAALHRVEGRVELGVKAFIDRDRFAGGGALRNDSIRELAEHAAQAEGGRAYLESRRLEQLVTEELMHFKADFGEELHKRLLRVADDGVQLSLQRPEVSGREEEMLFNGAYLVADRPRFEEELGALAGEHRDTGVGFELTGPWPPYNFVPAELGS
jgi:hypothetical protein